MGRRRRDGIGKTVGVYKRERESVYKRHIESEYE